MAKIRTAVAVSVALVAVVATSVNAANSVRQCFPASKWGKPVGGVAPSGLRPCVRITRIYEDGSFKFAVSDANGTVRYSGGVGATDR